MLAGLSREAVHSQLAAALDAVIHVVRDAGTGVRRGGGDLSAAAGVGGFVEAVPAVSFDGRGGVREGAAFGALRGAVLRT